MASWIKREDVHAAVNMQDNDAAPADDVQTAPADAQPDPLTVAQRERDEYLDALQRSRAEFINFRRRTEQDAERNRMRATESLIMRLLPVADDFERALRMVPDTIAAEPWTEGVRMVERKFWRVLEAENIQPMESLGHPFDPSRHEAVMVDDSGGVADTVIEEYQRGYLSGEHVLRPAMVKVGAVQAESAAASTSGANNT